MQYVKLKHHKSHYKSLRESPSDVAMTLMSFEANEDIITYLADTTTWEPARGTPWNDDKKKNSLVFVVDSGPDSDPGRAGHLRMRLHPNGKLSKTFVLRGPDVLPLLQAAGRMEEWNNALKKKKKTPLAPKKRVRKETGL